MYVVCWYVYTDAFPELHTADLAVLAAVPQETAEGVVIMQTVSDTAAHSRHWDGHHQCSEQSVTVRLAHMVHGPHVSYHSHSPRGVQSQRFLKHHVKVLQTGSSIVHRLILRSRGGGR